MTLNNYAEADIEVLKAAPSLKYCVIGREVGEQGTPHLQGYMYFELKRSLAQLKTLMPTAHWEISRGTVAENYAYCTKDGNFVEQGVMPATQAEKGAKGAARIKELWTLAKRGEFESLPPQQIKTWEYISMKYGPRVQDRPILKNLWVTGPSGCGKSSLIRSKWTSLYLKNLSKWWDGYSGENAVVVDDLDPEHAKYNMAYYLKIWGDHYAFNAEVKGGMLFIRPDFVIVTSQYSIEDCFPDDVESQTAIRRRYRVLNMEMGRTFDDATLFLS